MATLQQFALGKSPAELETMAEQLERMADVKAAAATQANTAAAQGMGTGKVAAAAKAGGAMAGKAGMAVTVPAKAAAGSSILTGGATVWTGNGLSLGLGVPHPVSRTQVCHAAGLTDNTAFHFSLA
ncbi:MAG TPA: hypothetical protein HPP75_07250 [Rhodospirillaceae bacterium]|nr:hypothetical protein [Rhodospirillaceae bacterium]